MRVLAILFIAGCCFRCGNKLVDRCCFRQQAAFLAIEGLGLFPVGGAVISRLVIRELTGYAGEVNIVGP